MTKRYKEIIKSVLEDISPNSVIEKQDQSETIYFTFIENKMGTLKRQLKIFLNDEDCNLKFKAYIDTNISEIKRNTILEMINGLQADYRFVKMYLNRNDDLIAEYEMILVESDAKYAFAQNVRMMIDLVTRVIMVYADKEEEFMKEEKDATGRNNLTLEQINLNPFR